MRDDVKIGILLGFLLVVGIFVYWLVKQPGAASTDRPVNLAATRTPDSTPSPAARPAPRATPAGSIVVSDTPAATPPPVTMPTRPTAPTPSTPPVADPPPVLDTVLPPAPTVAPSVPGVIGATPTAGGAVVPPSTSGGTPAPGTTTAAYDALEKATDGTRLYSTKENDSAWVLAARFYGNGSKWTLIKEANAGVDIEHHLPAGIKIKIPAPPAPVATPATPATPGTAAALQPNEYVVKEGDTLTKIAQEKLGKGVLWTKILEANPGLDERNLHVGKVIKLPPAAATPGTPTVTPTAPVAPTVGPNEYVIKEGDRLGAIAKDKLGKESLWTEIVKLNPGLDEKNLTVGKVIKLPPKPAAAPAPTPGSGTGATPGAGSGTGAGTEPHIRL
ncbi:MAG: LysM peptidoglycan-binding domain-containing protein [Phycisphaerae bacterium]|nr:LysM peptidoglycan-binding domain-containing protein [Phycisphaerae bacterium]